MTSSHSHLKMTCVEYRQWKWRIVVVMVTFLGVAIVAADCQAQAVPSRTQSQIMTKPIVPSPESPLRKEIGELRQEVQKNKERLKMTQQELEANRRFFQQVTAGYQVELDNYLRDPEHHPKVLEALAKCQAAQCKDCKAHFIGILRHLKTLYVQSGHP
jgi:hypothetical protein